MPDTDPISQIEGLNAMKDLARLVRSYYTDLVGNGFSKREAFRLVLDYQRAIVNQAKEGN